MGVTGRPSSQAEKPTSVGQGLGLCRITGKDGVVDLDGVERLAGPDQVTRLGQVVGDAGRGAGGGDRTGRRAARETLPCRASDKRSGSPRKRKEDSDDEDRAPSGAPALREHRPWFHRPQDIRRPGGVVLLEGHVVGLGQITGLPLLFQVGQRAQ